jgi:glycerol-3-phosphate acyltransferase PlsX
MRLAVDAMGGDHAPEPIVRGAVQALEDDDELHLTLVGDRDRIERLVTASDSAKERLTYDHTTDVVGMDESPAHAMRRKPNASVFRCWTLLADGKVSALVSAGHTGAVVAGGFRTRRFLKGVERPGIAVTVPTPTGFSIMIDVGANVKPQPEHLYQYGLMGVSMARQMFSLDKPMIGLLNVGSEEDKGNELAKKTQALFHGSHLRENFFGNVEGRDICRGVVDVIVCDGFVGNIALKCCEGMVEFLMSAVGGELLSTLEVERELAQRTLHKLHTKYHYSEFGGAPLLGIDGVCLICHGSSDDKAIRNAVRAAKRFAAVNRAIADELRLAPTAPTTG